MGKKEIRPTTTARRLSQDVGVYESGTSHVSETVLLVGNDSSWVKVSVWEAGCLLNLLQLCFYVCVIVFMGSVG